jgi:cell wall-associated NlpC family hydrolase
MDLAPFVGIPYRELVSGPDARDGCYGLVLRVYREALSLELEVPASGATSAAETRTAEAALLVAREALDWAEVAANRGSGLVWSRPPELLDVLWARIGGNPHVGLVASPDGRSMLHAYVPAGPGSTAAAYEAATSHIVTLDRPVWSRVLLAAYRHPARA